MNFFQSMRPSKTARQYFLGTASVLVSSLLLNMAGQVSASAQAAPYPTKSITMIVPFPPGGLADIVARPVAEAMSRELGQPVIIENKGGAGGGIGMGVAARSKPDGYTVLLALSSLTVIPEADALLGRNPMFLLNELRPIARYTADPTVLAVRADAPWKTVKEFVEENELNVYLILDLSASNNFGFMKSKLDLSFEVAVSLMFLALKNNDKLGLGIFTDKLEKFIPSILIEFPKNLISLFEIILSLEIFKIFIFGVPINWATKIFEGLLYISSGVPTCSIFP